MLSVVKVEIGGWACLHLDIDVGQHLWRQLLMCIWEVEAGEIWASSRCLPAVTVMQRGIYAHLSSVGIMRKTAPKTGRRTFGDQRKTEKWKQVAHRKHNISCKTRLLMSRELSWQEIRNHITGCKAELISNEKYHSRWTCFFYSKSLWNSFSHETCCELGHSGRVSFLRIRQKERTIRRRQRRQWLSCPDELW